MMGEMFSYWISDSEAHEKYKNRKEIIPSLKLDLPLTIIDAKVNILAENPYFSPNRENPKLLFLPHFSRRFLCGRLRGRAT